MKVRYIKDDVNLSAEQYVELVSQVWPGEYDLAKVQNALARTINITAWNHDQLVGCVRILTDGYLYSTVPEILVIPEFRGKGIGKALMEIAWELSPTSLYLESNPDLSSFFEHLGFAREKHSFVRLKGRGADF